MRNQRKAGVLQQPKVRPDIFLLQYDTFRSRDSRRISARVRVRGQRIACVAWARCAAPWLRKLVPPVFGMCRWKNSGCGRSSELGTGDKHRPDMRRRVTERGHGSYAVLLYGDS